MAHQAFLAKQFETMSTHRKQVCIPTALQAPVLTMSAVSPATVTADLPTIFIGMIDDDYTEDTWHNDMQQIGRIFRISGEKNIAQIKIKKAGAFVNTQEFGNEVIAAGSQINQLKPTAIRIVGLGFATSSFVADALATLIRSWQISPNEKHVQFITLGDSEDCHNLNFCKDLCLKQECKTLQYFSVSDYDIFGNLK